MVDFSKAHAQLRLPRSILRLLIQLVFCFPQRLHVTDKRCSQSSTFRGRTVGRERCWEDITIDVVDSPLKPEKRMRIMYKANLNYDRFVRYFQELLSKGLIEERNGSDGKAIYVISERGKTLLDSLRKARDIFDSGKT